MLSDFIPLLNDTVHHWLDTTRNVFGKLDARQNYTAHRAYVVFSPGVEIGGASGQILPNAKATVWLIDHPRPVLVGDTFTLATTGDVLKVVRLEVRHASSMTLTKVFLK